jgi:hypothetical protein
VLIGRRRGSPVSSAIKTVNIFPGNSGQGLPDFSTCCMTPKPASLWRRWTATDHVAPHRSRVCTGRVMAPAGCTLLVVGCGRVGDLLPAIPRRHRLTGAAVGPNRSPCRDWRSACVPTSTHTVVDLQRTRRLAIVSCATRPLSFRACGCARTSHLDLMATADARRPTTPALPGRGWWWTGAAKVASCWALWRAACSRRSVAGTLADLCRGAASSRPNTGHCVFKSVGTAARPPAAITGVATAGQGGMHDTPN